MTYVIQERERINLETRVSKKKMMQWEAQRRGTVMEEGGEVAQLRIRFELEGEGVKTERDTQKW